MAKQQQKTDEKPAGGKRQKVIDRKSKAGLVPDGKGGWRRK